MSLSPQTRQERERAFEQGQRDAAREIYDPDPWGPLSSLVRDAYERGWRTRPDPQMLAKAREALGSTAPPQQPAD